MLLKGETMKNISADFITSIVVLFVVFICILVLLVLNLCPSAYAEPLMESISQINVAIPGATTPVVTPTQPSSGGGGGGGINCNLDLYKDSTYCKDYCERFRKQYDCSKESYSAYTCCKGYVTPVIEEAIPSEPEVKEEPIAPEEETPSETPIVSTYGYNTKIFNPALLVFFIVTICVVVAIILKSGTEYRKLVKERKIALQKWQEGYAEYKEVEKKINQMGRK